MDSKERLEPVTPHMSYFCGVSMQKIKVAYCNAEHGDVIDGKFFIKDIKEELHGNYIC